MKECSKCKQAKEPTEFSSWVNKKTGSVAVSSRCKACVAEYSRNRYDQDKERFKTENKAYYERNKERVKFVAKAYYNRNKLTVRKKTAEYRAANLAKVNEACRAWKAANPERYKAAQQAWADRNRDKVRASSIAWSNKVKERKKEQWQTMRLMVMDHYGGPVCACCGETTYSFLTLDHIYNDGAAHRKSMGNKHLYRWIIANGYPDGFQVLCMNCNFGKFQNGGVCPHQDLNVRRLEETRTLQAIGSGSARQPKQLDWVDDIASSELRDSAA